MRYKFTLFLIGLVSFGFAQSPMLVNYQGIARDAGLAPIANQTISLKFEVLQGSPTGPVIYTDTQPAGAVTNSLGLFSTQIGKNGTLGQVNWQGGPYYLQVSMDAAGGSAYAAMGTQQIVSVPYAMHAQTVPSTYTNNVLTIGTKTHVIDAVTISQGTGTNITVSGGPNYTVSYAPPILALNGNSLSIAGSNTVSLPVALTPTLVPSGIVTVTNGASSYTVDVPVPSYNQTTAVLSFGGNNTVVSPTLGLSGGILYSGPFTNSVALPNQVSLSGTGLANVTGGPNYVVNVAPPTLTLSSNNLSISIVGSNSVALPSPVTVQGGNIATVSGGPTSYTVSVPNPVFTGTALLLGSSTTTIAPTLAFNPATGILTSGATSNSVSLSGSGPFNQAGSSVTLTTVSNSLAIGSGAASAKLDVFSNSGGNVLKVTDASAANASPAAVISSGGVKSLYVTNTSAGGVAGDFSSLGGLALTAQNNSNTFATFQAQNSSGATGAYAGNFIGGLSVTGNGSTAGDFAFKTSNSSSANLFAVRNDGNVGIGTITPSKKLDVAGSVKITDGTEAAGRVLTSDASGNASWQPLTLVTATTFTQQTINNVNITPQNFPAPLATFTKVNADTKIQVIIQTHLYVFDLIGNFGVVFEVRLGNTPAPNNSGKVAYFHDNANVLDIEKYESVTIIAEFPGPLSPGAYNINLAAYTAAGTAVDASFDAGNWGTNSVIIKEYR